MLREQAKYDTRPEHPALKLPIWRLACEADHAATKRLRTYEEAAHLWHVAADLLEEDGHKLLSLYARERAAKRLVRHHLYGLRKLVQGPLRELRDEELEAFRPTPYVSQAMKRRMAGQKRLTAAVLAANSLYGKMAAPSTLVRRHLGIPTCTIQGFARVEVSTTAPLPLRVLRLVIPSDVAGFLMVEDVRVGNLSLLAAGPVPAIIFMANAISSSWSDVRLEPGQTITLVLRSTTSAALIFNGAFITEETL